MSQKSEPIEGATPSPSDDRKLEGIAGWLVLLAIAQVLGVATFSISMISGYATLPPEIATAQPAAVFGAMIIDGAFLLLLVYTAFLFFTKSRRFPTTFIVSCLAGMLEPFLLLGFISVASGVPITSGSVGDGMTSHHLAVIAGSILWMAYVLNSVRVSNTFIR